MCRLLVEKFYLVSMLIGAEIQDDIRRVKDHERRLIDE